MDVVLSSSQRSGIYFDIKKAYGYLDILDRMADSLYDMFGDVEVVAGSGHGGIPLADRISGRHGLKLSLVRYELKKHGLQKYVDGYEPTKDDSVAVVDDVFTTGGSLLNTIEKLDGGIEGCYVVLKRGNESDFPYKLKYLFTASDFLD